MKRLFFLLVLLLPSMGEAQTKNPSLRGSRGSLQKQNAIADREDLTRIRNEDAIARFVRAGLLVPIPDGKYGIVVDQRLEDDRRYCRPWTVKFLKDLGTRFQKKFGKPIRVNSCVRDKETQEDLRDRNGNAARTSGPRASSHLTGSTVDIARIGLNGTEQAFIRSRLLFHERGGRIEATQESRQAVWHIMVFKQYAGRW